MRSFSLNKITGLFLIAVPVVFNVFFTLLQVTFEYPAILRKPTDYVLRQFQAGGNFLIFNWYGMVISAILFIPLAVLMSKILDRENSTLLKLAMNVGIVAGVVQILGLIRWVFLVPLLSNLYLDPTASSGTREAVNVVFQTFNTYAGVAVGENMGYLFTGGWTILISLYFFMGEIKKPLLGGLGLGGGLLILAGMLEPLGFELAGTLNVFGYIVWSVWLVATGITLLRKQTASATASPKVEVYQ